VIKRCLLACLLAFLAAPGVVRAAPPGPVVVIPIKTEISAAQFFFLRRALKEAERAEASAVVLDMDTYGGEVRAANDSMDALLKTRVPTYIYINPRAISAGALIALATQKIYMAPSAVIGAAAPVTSGGEDLPKTMTDKTVSALSAMARAAAEKNGHRPEVADAFISKDREVKIGDVVVHKADSLLTLSASEATKLYDNQPLLAAGLADSLEEMLKSAGLTGAVQTIEPSGFEQAAFWITSLAPLFLLGGMLGAYIEFKTPGFGLPGILSLCCFVIFFTGHYLAGLAGWEVGVFFFLGLLLVLGELILHPGTILPGVAGLLLMVGAVLWAMIDRYPGEPFLPTTQMLARPLWNLGLALLLAILAGWVLAKYLPKTSFYHRIVLLSTVHGSPATAAAPRASAVQIGQSGTAHSMLRPAGKAEFGGQTVDVVTEGDFIDPGTAVRVVAMDGLRVVVARV
jgi:membrane-bound serine protease (ClpP class)